MIEGIIAGTFDKNWNLLIMFHTYFTGDDFSDFLKFVCINLMEHALEIQCLDIMEGFVHRNICLQFDFCVTKLL